MEQFKRVKIIMLPAKNILQNGLQPYSVYSKPITKGDWMLPKSGAEARRLHQNGNQAYHLYIISDDEIKESDYVYDSYKDSVYQATKVVIHNMKSLDYEQYLKKIIATTDTSLKEKLTFGGKNIKIVLPQPSQQFIKKYIESYNKSEIITDVLVKYEGDYDEHYKAWYAETVQPKVNPIDNTITIKKLKNNWNREEVIELIKEWRRISGENRILTKNTFDKWISDNL